MNESQFTTIILHCLQVVPTPVPDMHIYTKAVSHNPIGNTYSYLLVSQLQVKFLHAQRHKNAPNTLPLHSDDAECPPHHAQRLYTSSTQHTLHTLYTQRAQITVKHYTHSIIESLYLYTKH